MDQFDPWQVVSRLVFTPFSRLLISIAFGALVAQWFKHWPADLAVPSSSPTPGEIFKQKQGSIAHSLSLSASYLPN